MSDKVLHVGDADFDAQVLQSDVPVLVDFWAPWCAPCKAIGPLVEELAQSYEGRAKIVKLDVQDHQNVPRQFAVRNIPTLIMFKGGKPVGTQMGVPGDIKQRLTKLIDSAL